MKKIISMLLAMMMIATLTVTAFAAGEGSITITHPDVDATYNIYKIFDLALTGDADAPYSYTLTNENWLSFFTTGEGKNYISLDDVVDDKGTDEPADDEHTYYVAGWIGEDSETRKAAFAKAALKFATDNSIGVAAPEQTADKDDTTVVFSDLQLGYYLVDTSIGALCGLTTTKPHADVVVKNEVPTLEKDVQEDSTSNWGDDDTASIGETVHYVITVDAQKGAQNYEVHDKMSEGLTFTGIESIKLGTETIDSSNYTLYTAKSDDDYDSPEDDCTFEIIFNQSYLDTLDGTKDIVITYSAVLNENAVIAGEGNPNDAWLEYGDNHTTTSSTTTYTYSFDLKKTDGSGELLDGAKFQLQDKNGPIYVVKKGEVYYPATEDTEGADDEFVVTGGKITFVGFDAGEYSLVELEAPAGYNKLTAPYTFKITNANLLGNDAVTVVNRTGTELPETGGMGTTLFITFGAIAVLGTGVLLVTKKRMGMIQD